MKDITFKSKRLWVAIAAFIPLLFTSLETYGINLMLPDNYDLLVKSFLGILVMAGILSVPDKSKKKGDK